MTLTVAEHERVATAYHEAGHAVACILAGARIHEVALTDERDTPGLCRHEIVSEAAEREITFAGIWGEARFRHGPLPTIGQIREVLGENGSDREFLTASGEPLPPEVEPLLERCLPAIATVARQLYATGRSDHTSVCAALGLGGDGTGIHDRSVLASIRGGMAAVPA